MNAALGRRFQPVPVSKAVDRFLQVSLLGMLASGYLAVAGSGALDTPSLAVTGAAILLRALMVAGLVRAKLSDGTATILAIAYIGFYPIDLYFLSREFFASLIHLVFFVGAVLVVKASTRRDYFFLKLVALLEVLAASLLSASLTFLACLAVFVLCAVAAQVSGELHANLEGRRAIAREGVRGAHRRLAGLTIALLLGIVIIGAGLFFVLPRTAHAALRHLIPERYHLPGFANEVVLGQIGELRMTQTPVFHARISPPRKDRPLALKWRGSALRQFDGQRWFNETDRGEIVEAAAGHVSLGNEELRYRKGVRIVAEVQLKSVAGDVLFIPGTPEAISIDTQQLVRTSVGGYRTGIGLPRSTSYRVQSVLDLPEPEPVLGVLPLSPEDRAAYLRLPARLDPRIPNLARDAAARAIVDLERAKQLERRLRTGYGYTTELLRAAVPDPLAYFLFVRKKGHCEYFASSMAVMLRTLGIPSRVATGFQSGAYNPISDSYLIRASDAHSWVEAWFPRYGWVTFDPTPPDLSRGAGGLWSRVQLYLDAMEIFWQDWVMSYDIERQMLLAGKIGEHSRTFSGDWIRRLQFDNIDWNSLSPNLGLVVAIAGTAAWIFLAARFGPRLWVRLKEYRRLKRLQRSHGNPSDATVLYQRMLHLLKRRGIQKPAWVTPAEFASMIPPGESRRIVEQLTEEYHALRFGGRGDAAPRMVMLLERLAAAPRS